MSIRAANTASDPEVLLVQEWHSALNAVNIERLLELSHSEVEVGGPRSHQSGNAEQLLGDWVQRANIRLSVRRLFHRPGTIVAEEDAQWRDADTGEISGTQTVGTTFAIRDGRVASILRHPTLDEALEAAALDVSHETTLRS